MSSLDLYSEIPLPYENDSNKSLYFDVSNIPLPRQSPTNSPTKTKDSTGDWCQSKYIPTHTTTAFRRDGNTVTPIRMDDVKASEYDAISKQEKCSYDIWDDGDQGLAVSNSILRNSIHSYYYPRSREWVSGILGSCEAHWGKARRSDFKNYSLPSQYDCECAMKDFQEQCESRHLLVATSGDISPKMSYMFPSNAFYNVESIMFLLKCYFEYFPIEIFLAFKINCSWGDEEKDFSRSGHITLKTALHHDGWMLKDFRSNVQQQYQEIMTNDYRGHINRNEEKYVGDNLPMKVKLEKFKTLTIVMKHVPDQSKLCGLPIIGVV